MPDVESLELKIVGSSADAVKGLDALISTLGRLQTATAGGCGLSAIATPLNKISKIASSLNGTEGAKIQSLADGLKSLSSVSSFKISTNIANQITAIGEAVKNQASVDYSTFNSMLASLQDVASKFSSLPAPIQNYTKASASIPTTNLASALSFRNLASKVVAVGYSLKRVVGLIASCINKSSEYTENLSLFNVSMGEYADDALKYANQVEAAMGINPSEWIRNQGVFMTLATGFGSTAERANTMSKELTQLGYDLSSFYNIDVSEAMDKLKSGFSGELEPLRNLGYDLSQAKLEAVALSLGIDKSVSSMTQAEKAELRYYAIMTQVTQVQGDMARTLDHPANQLRVFRAQLEMTSKAIGDLFIPMLNDILPVAIAVVKVIRYLTSALANLFRGTRQEEGAEEALEGIASSSGNASSSLEEATKNAGKLRKQLLGIDELNVMSDSSGSGSDVGSGSGFDFALPTSVVGDWLNTELENKVKSITEEFKKWLGITENVDTWSEFFDTRLSNILETVGMIATGLAAWKLSVDLLKGIETLKKLASKNFTFSFGILGAVGFIADLDMLKKYCEDLVENGPTFYNVAGILSEFAGLIGDAFLALGKVEAGSALKLIQGIGEIASALADINQNGFNFDNAMVIVRGVSNILIFVGAQTKNWKLTGVAMALQGGVAVIRELVANWDAIREGDWSGVDKATMVIGAIEVLAGIMTALEVFNKVKGAVDTAKTTQNLTEVTTVTQTVSTTTSTVTQKLGSLVKNLGLGIAIIAEVAAAAIIFVGAIWVLGKELEQVGIAWEPVIANGNTVLIAMGIGTGILVAVGVVTALLGTLGGAMAGQIGIGIAILAELGVAAGLFILEIWAIGKGLDEIGKAWEPVLDNGEDIATAIGIGTGLLVGIGVVAAALGVATVASAGLLPVAIAVGTGMLVELTDAFVEFTDSLIKVGNKLKDDLHPCLKKGKAILPPLTENMEEFTDFMSNFAGEVVEFTKANAISGIAATVDKIVDFFTADPIDSLAKEIKKQYNQMTKLVDNLNEIVPVLQDADRLMGEFNSTMDKLKAKMGVDGKASGTISYIITVGVALAKSGWKSIDDWIGNLSTTLKIKLPHVSVSWDYAGEGEGAVKYPKFGVQYYAQGGFPAEGEMFVAREAGPELVGSIGNRSAVVNNDQIVSAVSQGVYQAVVQANAQSGNQTVEAKVNDRVLFEVVLNRNRQETMRKGYNPLMGGV